MKNSEVNLFKDDTEKGRLFFVNKYYSENNDVKDCEVERVFFNYCQDNFKNKSY